MILPNGEPYARFFEYGEVSIQSHDPHQRMASLRVQMPCCLMQTVTPALLGAGLIDKYEVMAPFAAWIPELTEDRFKPEVIQISSGIPSIATNQLAKTMKSVLELFTQFFPILKDPSDVIPILPLGTYITFQYRCRVDAMVKVLDHLESIHVAGVAEFRFALATVLAFILTQEGSTEQLEQ